MNTTKIIDRVKKDKIINLIKKYSDDVDVYLVGGIVRDFYLGKENFDKDIIVDKIDAGKFAKRLAKLLDAKFIPLDEENKIYRLILKDKINYIDITNPIGDSLEEDLKRRDLTINAIAINLKTNEILDFSGGLADLKLCKIRHISEKNFKDDSLRLLRAFRFQAMLNYEIDENLIEIIKAHASKIKNSAKERINYELLKLFSGDYTAKTLTLMDKVGLLQHILPIISDLKKVPSNSHHHLNLFEHSIETVKQIQEIYKNASEKEKEHLENIDFGGASRLAHLKLAAFLHDIGKFKTWTIEENTGKHRFIKHDDVGSKMVSEFLKATKFSKKQTDYIAKMVKYHIYPSHVICAPEVNEKIYMRLIRKMNNDVIDIITLAKADRLSARGVEITEEIINKNISGLNSLLFYYLEVKDTLKPLEKLLSGNDVMEILQIKPSKELGVVLKALKEAQLAGEVNTKQDAISFVEALIKN